MHCSWCDRQYSTANQDDLWRHLSVTGAASLPEGVSVKSIMDTWTYQKGYPVVNVTRTNNSLTLSQVMTEGSKEAEIILAACRVL